MTPKPTSPHASEILGSNWEDTLTPEVLSQKSVQLGKVSADLLIKSEDGQVKAMNLLGHGSGVLAEAISAAWVKYFVMVGNVGMQFGQASAALASMAATIGGMHSAMAGIVGAAENAIASLEAGRVAMEAAGHDVDEMIQQVITDAKAAVQAASAAAATQLAGVAPAGMSPIAGGTPPTSGSPPGAGGANTPPASAPGGGGMGDAPTANPASAPGGGGMGDAPTANPASAPGGGGMEARPAAMVTPGGGVSGGGGAAPAAPGGGGGAPSAVPGGAGASPGMGAGPAAGTGGSSPGLSPAGSAPAAGPPPAGVSPAGDVATAPAAASSAPAAPVAASAPPAGGAPGVAPAAAASPAAAAPAAAPVVPVGLASVAAAAPAAAIPAAGMTAMAAPGLASTVAAAAVAPAPPPVVHAPPAASLQAAAPPPAAAVPAPAPTPVAPGQPAAGVPAAATAAANPAPSHTSSPAPVQAPPSGASSVGQGPGPGQAQDAPRQDPVIGPALAPVGSEAAPVPMLLAGGPVVADMFVPGEAELASLREVIAASGGSAVGWAAGLLATDAGRRIAVTTDRGRGWLPEHVLLPADVEWPWRHEDSARWEGLLDPARVIVEYASASGADLVALASTRMSAPAVAAGIPFEVVQAGHRPRPDLLSGPLVSREFFAVSEERLAAAEQIVDPLEQRRRALWIAYEAVRVAGLTTSSVRGSLLTALLGGDGVLEYRRINRLPWDALIAENEVLGERERAGRVDVRDVARGDLDTGGGQCRELLKQSYANEALLSMMQASSRRALMDALYAWSMMLDLDGVGREDVRHDSAAVLR